MIGKLFLVGAAFSLAVFGQGVTVTPGQLDMLKLEAGPVSLGKKVSIQSAGKWTASVDVDWMQVSPASGTGNGTIAVTQSNTSLGLARGDYRGNLTITPDTGAAVVVPVQLHLIPRGAGPQFSYLWGPAGCTQPDGLPDAATCIVPDEKPPGTFVPPAIGGSYIDPNFGSMVRVLAGPYALHGYSAPNALNANNTYAILADKEGTIMVDVAKAATIYRPNISQEGAMWDAVDPNIVYSVNGAAVVKHDVRTHQTTVMVDYTKPPFNLKSIRTGGSSDTSKDNWIPFYSPNDQVACTLDVNTMKSYCGKYDTATIGLKVAGDAIFVAKGPDRTTGKRYVILASYPAAVIYSVNLAAGKLDFEYLGPEQTDYPGNKDGICDAGETCITGDHSDVFEDSDGTQYMIIGLEAETPCEFSIYTLQLNKGILATTPVEAGGGMKRMLTLFRCGTGDNWTDYHAGCAKLAPLCVISTTYGGFNFQRKLGDTTPINRTPHLSEVMVIRGNGEEIRRVFEHRSVPIQGEEAQSYWTTARACISNDGTYVVADSNFGVAEGYRVVTVETGFGKTRFASTAAVEAAAMEAQFAPGSVISLLGQNLANCRASAAGAPVPNTLCTTQVQLNGQPAPVLYASPSQLNVQVPQNTQSGQPVAVQVTRGPNPDDSAAVTLPGQMVVDVFPRIYAYQAGGVSRAVVLNADGTVNGPGNGLHLGDAAVLYANGLGAVTPLIPDGTLPPDGTTTQTISGVAVLVNKTTQTVDSAGWSASLVGLYEVRFHVDPSTPISPKDDNSVAIRANGVDSKALTISLQN